MQQEQLTIDTWNNEIDEIEATLDCIDHIKDVLEQAQDDILIEKSKTPAELQQERLYTGTRQDGHNHW